MNRSVLYAGCVGFMVACTSPRVVEMPVGLEGDASAAIYFDRDDADDPLRELYAEFRARRERDMRDPSKPPALPRHPSVHKTREMPWTPIDEVLRFDWEALRDVSPAAVDQLDAAVRMRLAFDHPDLKITQILIGPGGSLPSHADGAPGLLIAVGGRGEITIEGESWLAESGTTAKLEPYDERRMAAVGDEPFRLLWIRWAPGGDQSYIDAGYYLTGANAHIQPDQADMPDDYAFWHADYAASPRERPTRAVVERKQSADAVAAVREPLGASRNLYPGVARFGHESDRAWLSAETLKRGGFFFSADAGRMGPIVDRMIRIARHKAIFRASRPDGTWDFNFSQSAWGPRSTYVEHSHLVPEFYYAMSGPVIYGVDDEAHRLMPGDVVLNNSYAPHFIRGIVDGMAFDTFSSTWAPNGDRSVFGRRHYLLEPLPDQPASSALPADIAFH